MSSYAKWSLFLMLVVALLAGSYLSIRIERIEPVMSVPCEQGPYSEMLKGILNGLDEESYGGIDLACEEIDLNGDGVNELLIDGTNTPFCGSGGCSMWIYDKKGDEYAEIGYLFGARLEILSHRTHGYCDLLHTYKHYLSKGGFKEAWTIYVWNPRKRHYVESIVARWIGQLL